MNAPRSGCHCVDIAMGSYNNQVSMLAPFDQSHRDDRWVCIDTCIATEIGWLWHQGVVTLNSCCGHQQMPAWVIVTEDHYDLMESLGYEWTLAPSGVREHVLQGHPQDRAMSEVNAILDSEMYWFGRIGMPSGRAHG